MGLHLQRTGDGSVTLYSDEFAEIYHSRHGAWQESMHVFIQAGLVPALAACPRVLRILEVGFGTGLNAALTLEHLHQQSSGTHIAYVGLEPLPVDATLIAQLNYGEYFQSQDTAQYFHEIHAAQWNTPASISPIFTLHKSTQGLQEFQTGEGFDLVYFDAFAPEKHPEMWSLQTFAHLASLLRKGAIFVTYCAKGQIRRDLASIGFEMERLPGPPGKREMLRGIYRG